jgi:hypothetical protein
MTATTTALTLTPGSYEASVEVTFAADGARCLGFSAQPSEEWLAVNPNAGALPALITVHALPELFPRDGSEPLVADIVVHATGPDVAGSPLTIRVTVDLPDEGTVFIPVASKP